MKRRGFLKSVASIPAFTVVPGLSDRESTDVVVNMRYQQMMDHGSLRVLKHGDVAKDVTIQNRDVWRMSSESYAHKFGISIPDFESFDLHKFLFHENKFWSLGYQKPGFTLNLIDSVDGPYRAMIFDIDKGENVAVAESGRFDVVVEDIKSSI